MQNNKGFPSDWLLQLKRKNDLVSIASNYLHLEQKGRRFWGCCPFHSEKTPSFTISNEDGIYYCFGCKESGDVIKFVQKMENLDFWDAVKYLADRAGMEIPQTQSGEKRDQSKKLKERILSALDYAYKHYEENLYSSEAKPAQEYIKKRKFTRHELEDFKIGYSKDWTDIVKYLKGKGFSEEELLQAGICAKKNDRIYDVIAGRLVFPIFNSFNECIGFSARSLESNPKFAKYLNTAETMVFQKGRTVFGINILKAQKQQQLLKNIILVEGQMDVIAMHRGGFKSTVACMGTAFTKDHVQELKRYSNKIVLCFDGDGAGTKATLRAIEMLRGEDVDLKVVALPDGHDPDEILNMYGKEKLQEMIDNAIPYMDYLINYYKNKFDLEKAEEQNQFVKAILAEVKKLGDETLYEPYLEKIRDITKIPLDILRRNINSNAQSVVVAPKEKQPVTPTEKGDEKAVKFLLAALLHKRDSVDKRVDYQKLLPEYEKYLDIINQNLPLSSIYDIDGASEDALLMEMVNFNFAEFEKEEEKYFRECLWKIAEQRLKKEQIDLNDEYRNCEDLTRRSEVAKRLGKIALQLKNKSLEEFYGRR